MCLPRPHTTGSTLYRHNMLIGPALRDVTSIASRLAGPRELPAPAKAWLRSPRRCFSCFPPAPPHDFFGPSFQTGMHLISFSPTASTPHPPSGSVMVSSPGTVGSTRMGVPRADGELVSQQIVPRANAAAKALVVCLDTRTIDQVGEVLQTMSIEMETCVEPQAAIRRMGREKVDALFVDPTVINAFAFAFDRRQLEPPAFTASASG